jgi:hypothetical protein
MGKNVFVNGRELSCSKDDTHIMGAMPDICLSPPSPPAGPIPIPYPNFAQASDTADGSKDVSVGGDQCGMKSSSNFSKCNGDEAATKTFGGNPMSGCIQGKTTATAWSFDVKIEGANAHRLMDLTTNNNT